LQYYSLKCTIAFFKNKIGRNLFFVHPTLLGEVIQKDI